MRNLLIDDLREVAHIHAKYGIALNANEVARTFAEGINSLKAGKIDTLLLDHDLGCFDDEGNELTGYKVMLFLEEHPEYLPNRIVLVTSNPVGRAKMQTVIDKLYQK